MLLLPAIDLRGGKAVRLQQGDYDRETVFSDDPVATARRWVEEGGTYLHLVDLDGAKAGKPANTEVIRRIVAEAGVPCQLGGGIRDTSAIDAALELGIARVIVGTAAVKRPEWFREAVAAYPGKVVLGLDARDGLVATEGWTEGSTTRATDLAATLADLPLAAIVYTDISRDGMMTGPNVAATAALAASSPHLVVASGGVSKSEDVLELATAGVKACILGRSLYEGAIDLPTLVRRLSS